jgi:hypothetical protein
MMRAIPATRPGGHVGYVGVAHDLALPGEELFFSHAAGRDRDSFLEVVETPPPAPTSG